MIKKHTILLALALCTLTSFVLLQGRKPILYIIGDSTVRNGDGSGKNKQWGWGSFMYKYFDTTEISVRNHAIGGRSSRTFLTEGRWQNILNDLRKGDIVLIQFGHNDAGPLDDTARARGTIRGIGNESKEIYNPIRKQQETVYTYGWYMRKYIREAREKGAIPYVCSPVPRDNWTPEGKAKRGNEDYAGWAKQIALEEKACFIDLNNLIADKYDELGKEKVAPLFFGDHTHTSEAGAKLNAAVVATELQKKGECSLDKYMYIILP